MPDDLVSDLTRRNAELEAQAVELTRMLAQAEAVSHLTTGVIHDLRNALHVMLTAGNALQESLLDPEQRELSDLVMGATRHAAALAHDVLNLARKGDAKAALFDSAELLLGFQRVVRQVLSKLIECDFEPAPSAWSVNIEAQQFEAVLINLSVNARDSMPRGGRLRIGTRNLQRGVALPHELQPGEYVEFYVADTGTGMPQAVLDRATEAFFTTKLDRGGTGLGLSMAQSFASRAGGALVIESEIDRGTCVRLLVPRAIAPSETRKDDVRLSKLQNIQSRIRTPWMSQLLDQWHAACGDQELPLAVDIEASLSAQAECSLLLAIEPGAEPPVLRLIRIGDALSRALRGAELGTIPLHGPLALGDQGAAYRRVLRSRFPSYEFLRYTFGAGENAEFERLILPAATDGATVSHLIGAVRLSTALGGGD